MDHLEYLKTGFEESQKRFQEAQAKLQQAQVAFNIVSQEFNAWQTLYRGELAKQGPQLPAPPAPQLPVKTKAESNQTEAVRSALRDRPTGMTPDEVWKQVGQQLTNRTYLYSVLKRLKEKGDAVERRGKYFPKIRPESEGGPTVVQ